MNKESLKIVVGSTSEHKIGAVKKACLNLGVEADVFGTVTTSGVKEQPEGLNQGYIGAFVRARSARDQYESGFIAIGIESCIVPLVGIYDNVTLDMACIVVLCPNGRKIVTTSSGIVFPEKAVSKAREQGFETVTVGSVIAEECGGDGTDPHSILTNGKVSRELTLVSALEVALRQLPEIGS